jgi:hypothetical protein
MQSAEALWLRGPWVQQPPPSAQHAPDSLAHTLASCAPHLRHLRTQCPASLPCTATIAQGLLGALGSRLVSLDLQLPWPCTPPPALRGCTALQHLTLRCEEPEEGCNTLPAGAGAAGGL